MVIDWVHLGRILLIIVPLALVIGVVAWLLKQRFGLETPAWQRSILVGMIAGLLAGFRFGYDLQRAAWVGGIIVVGFFVNKLVNDLWIKPKLPQTER